MTFKQEVQNIKQRFQIIGNSPKLNYAIQIAIQVAATDLNVLITGESGSGKESFSKIIHHLSHRKHKHFIALNCGAIPSGTIDSELFGHEKGAFTDATEARKGYFEVTDGGTIFLDEIGEMPLGTQARLLRILENKEFIRVGSSKVQTTDVRVVAATNVNLLEKIQLREFREDLYYRLSTVPIHVPPLRERGEDIAWIFIKFASDFAERYHIEPIQLTPEAEKYLLRYRFPGNIRQLKNITEQISALEMERTIDLTTLKKYLHNPVPSQLPIPLAQLSNSTNRNTFSDREILYNILFDMKRDMNELKRLIFMFFKNPSQKLSHNILEENKHLFRDMDLSILDPNLNPQNKPLLDSKAVVPIDDYIEDVAPKPPPEPENFSLQENEKEMILKALTKHNHKRRLAAHELGISERTLFRKIKQYQIEKVKKKSRWIEQWNSLSGSFWVWWLPALPHLNYWLSREQP